MLWYRNAAFGRAMGVNTMDIRLRRRAEHEQAARTVSSIITSEPCRSADPWPPSNRWRGDRLLGIWRKTKTIDRKPAIALSLEC